MGGLKLAYYVSILYIKNNYYMSCRAILRYVTMGKILCRGPPPIWTEGENKEKCG